MRIEKEKSDRLIEIEKGNTIDTYKLKKVPSYVPNRMLYQMITKNTLEIGYAE
jgi:hypothetical protein